jgi:hypothetical protein
LSTADNGLFLSIPSTLTLAALVTEKDTLDDRFGVK